MSGNWFTCKIAGRENDAVYKEDKFSSVEQEILEFSEGASDFNKIFKECRSSIDIQNVEIRCPSTAIVGNGRTCYTLGRYPE